MRKAEQSIGLINIIILISNNESWWLICFSLKLPSMTQNFVGNMGSQIAAELSFRAAEYRSTPTSVQICHSHVVSQSYGYYLECQLSSEVNLQVTSHQLCSLI